MEVDTHLSVKLISRLTNPLDWWKENNTPFSYLAQLAKTSLCIPATSTPDLPKGCSQRGYLINYLLKEQNLNSYEVAYHFKSITLMDGYKRKLNKPVASARIH